MASPRARACNWVWAWLVFSILVLLQFKTLSLHNVLSASCVSVFVKITMNVATSRRLIYSVFLLHACSVSAALDDVCDPELCWSAPLTDRCAAACQRWIRSVDDQQTLLPVIQTDKRTPSAFVRIGKSAVGGANKRYSSFVRIGRQVPKRYSSFVRIGRAAGDHDALGYRVDDQLSPAFNKHRRYSSFVRIGRSADLN